MNAPAAKNVSGYVQKDIAYKDVTEAAWETMRRIVDQLESVENTPESIQQKLMELALEHKQFKLKDI